MNQPKEQSRQILSRVLMRGNLIGVGKTGPLNPTFTPSPLLRNPSIPSILPAYLCFFPPLRARYAPHLLDIRYHVLRNNPLFMTFPLTFWGQCVGIKMPESVALAPISFFCGFYGNQVVGAYGTHLPHWRLRVRRGVGRSPCLTWASDRK